MVLQYDNIVKLYQGSEKEIEWTFDGQKMHFTVS